MSERPLLLGVEIGGTKLQLGVGYGNGVILALERRAVRPEDGSAGILAQMTEAVDVLRCTPGLGAGGIAAVGIGFGGPVDSRRGIVTTSHQVGGWDHFPLAEWFADRFSIPCVVLQNDADTAGLGEAQFGAGAGYSPILYVTIGSGIGGGLIIDGQIYRGNGLGALEIGHLWVIDRLQCDKDILKLEDVASGWAITRAAREFAQRPGSTAEAEPWLALQLADGDPARITPAVVAEAARLGDREAGFILGRAIAAMASALNQAVTLLAPRRIILGGGVSLIGEDQWFQPIRILLDLQVLPPFRGSFDVVPAALSEVVVVHGALALARDELELRAGTSHRP
jgi:glucokinase